MPSVSVIIPVYNVECYLERCLTSVECQTLEDIEIIVVNDGSTDGSLGIIEAHAGKDTRIKVIDKPNGGYGHTINCGISAATGDYIGIVESDDFIEPEMFEVLYRAAIENDLDIARVNYWLYWSRPKERNEFLECYRKDVCGTVFDPRDLKQCFFFPPALWSMIVRRDMIDRCGLSLLETPGASFQDTSFSFKLWACAKRAMLIHEPYLHYRQDNESSSINNKQKAYYVCEEYAEAERFVRDDISDTTLLPLVNRRRFDAYRWNLSRIGRSLRSEFAQKTSLELAHALEAEECDPALYSEREWEQLELWVQEPEAFLALLDRQDRAPAQRAKRFIKKMLKRG